jgi:hypothetical protein
MTESPAYGGAFACGSSTRLWTLAQAWGALRAVEDELGGLVEVLAAAEVRAPGLLVGRQPDGLALGALRD